MTLLCLRLPFKITVQTKRLIQLVTLDHTFESVFHHTLYFENQYNLRSGGAATGADPLFELRDA